jgi:hypothetical protein
MEAASVIKHLVVTFLALLAAPAVVLAGEVGPPNVYGKDDRREVLGLTGARAEVADSSVALVDTFDMESNNDGTTHLYGESLQDFEGLCPGQRFAQQPVVAFCSGALVGPDVVVTAGHCVEERSDLRFLRFVFGFRMLDAQRANIDIPNGEIYRGVQLLSRRQDDLGADYALVRLDRTVTGHKPLAVKRSNPAVGTPLYVVGYPTGLPEKLAAGATVRALTPYFFTSNLDVFAGNSGSPVLDARTNEVVGVVVRGNPDYVTRGQCAVPLVLPNSYAATQSTLSSAFAPFLPRH